jgi:hypothetical protein
VVGSGEPDRAVGELCGDRRGFVGHGCSIVSCTFSSVDPGAGRRIGDDADGVRVGTP